MQDRRVLVAGNPDYGVASALRERFPSAAFASRSAGGFDLTDLGEQRRLAKVSLEHDVFVACSCLHHFHQTLLVKHVIEEWAAHGHRGHLVALGSTADTPVKGILKIYPIEKKALRAYLRNLSFAALGGHGQKPPGFRVTYLSMGYIDTPSMNARLAHVNKIDPSYVAEVVEWVISQPSRVNVNEVTIDPIQMDSI